jgi:hypothetical protein
MVPGSARCCRGAVSQLPEQQFPPHHAYGVATDLIVDVRQCVNQRFMPFNDLGLRTRKLTTTRKLTYALRRDFQQLGRITDWYARVK